MNENMGIYKITNEINGKVYVGQSKDLKARKRSHFSDLKRNQHANFHLQNAFNKYKVNNFIFEILEICKEDELDEKEYKWMNKFNSHNSEFGYNITSPVNTNKHVKYVGVKYEEKEYNSYFMKTYDKEELISCLQELYYMEGRVPVSRDLNKSNLPSPRVYYEVFGSFKNALIESDLFWLKEDTHAFDREEYTKDDIKRKISVFIYKYDRFPNNAELRNSSKYDLPSYTVITDKFNSIHNLRKELGFDKESLKKQEQNEALEALMLLYKIDGKITSRSIDKSRITRSTAWYIDNFGSVTNALKLSGILDIMENKKGYRCKDKYTKESVIESVSNFIKENGRFPLKKELENNCNLPTPNYITKFFGSVENLRAFFKFDGNSEKENALKALSLLYESEGEISQVLVDKSNLTRSSAFYYRNFGGLAKACKLAGVPYATNI